MCRVICINKSAAVVAWLMLVSPPVSKVEGVTLSGKSFSLLTKKKKIFNRTS